VEQGRAAATWRAHWPEYLIEATCLGLFMVAAGLVTTALEYPGSWLHRALPYPLLRRALIGVAMGLTAVALIYSPMGRRSGAHMNPAVTLGFLSLGRMARADAFAYIVAQCIGGVAGVWLLQRSLGAAFTQPPVNWVATLPGPGGPLVAFAAETALAALLMTVVLRVSSHARAAALTGVCAGALVACFITFEAPLSGMSLNPARSLASAGPAGLWQSLWIYVLAPPLGMLAAAQWHRRRGSTLPCAKLRHSPEDDCIHCGQRGTRRPQKERPWEPLT
jgi:aquaporin Z